MHRRQFAGLCATQVPEVGKSAEADVPAGTLPANLSGKIYAGWRPLAARQLTVLG
jgi:hypothetical protein